jgi:hypothetical protein
MKLTKTFNEDEFIQICRSLNYNKKKTIIATKFFVEKWGVIEVWLWLCETKQNPPEYDSLKKMKNRIKKDLETLNLL